MDNPNLFQILVAVRPQGSERYRENLSKESRFAVTLVTSEDSARQVLANPAGPFDVFVVDNNIGDVFEWIRELRRSHPRLLIIIVDEEADYASAGRADEVSIEPFKENDLIKKIKRLSEERNLQTLRADSLPAVRMFAKTLRRANKGMGMQQAAVGAVKELGYDHVIFYATIPGDPPSLSLSAQVGPDAALSSVLPRLDYNNVIGVVAQTGEPRIVGPSDSPSHSLIERGFYGAALVVPVGTNLRFGVIAAFRQAAGSIKQESIVMLELISAQLASALAKDQRS